MMLKHFSLLFVVVLLTACGGQQPVPLTHISGNTMGTTYNVKFATFAGYPKAKIQTEIEQRLYEINKLMSTYDPESELSQFNNYRFTTPFQISTETELVIREAIKIGELSDGVLDITVGPLVNLWGFGPTLRPEKVPNDEQIAEVSQYVGLEKLELGKRKLSKKHPMLYVDLSTIAKGYAVDQLAALVERYGIEDYLVEIGGEMRVKGRKPQNEPWRIAIEKPVSSERAIQRLISVGDNAVATSGDYRNYYEEAGVRYSHLINPATGRPIQHTTVAVTVVHESSMVADGLATAFIVMGWEKAIKLAEENDLAVFIIRKNGDDFEEYESPKFSQLVTTY